MASVIVIKHSNTISTPPTTGDIIEGEFGLNTIDKKLYSRDDANNIIQVSEQDGTAEGVIKRWDDTAKTWDEVTNFTVSSGGAVTISGTADVTISTTGDVIISSMPTSDPLVSGALWNDSGTVKVSA